MSFSFGQYSDASGCYVTGGFYNSLGEKPMCSLLPPTTLLATTLLVNNFNGMVQHSVNGSYVTKIEIAVTAMDQFNPDNVFVMGRLYANSDARSQAR